VKFTSYSSYTENTYISTCENINYKHKGWSLKLVLTIFKNSIPSSQKTRCLHITQTNRLILFRDITSVCCGKGKKHESTLRGEVNWPWMGTESQKASMDFVLCPSVCSYATTRIQIWRISVKFGIGTSMRKSVKNKQIRLNSSSSHVDRSTFTVAGDIT
jgi:hypothetical protein